MEFEADSGNVRKADTAGADWQGGRWAVDGLKASGLISAPEAESRDQVEAEQVTAVRPEGAPGSRRPWSVSMILQVAGQAVAVHGIEQENVPGTPEARVPVQQCSFSGGDSPSQAAIGGS